MKYLIVLILAVMLFGCGPKRPGSDNEVMVAETACTHPVPECPGVTIGLVQMEMNDGSTVSYPTGAPGITNPDPTQLTVDFTLTTCAALTTAQTTAQTYTFLASECSSQKF